MQTMNLAARLQSKVLDDWAPHIDAYTWHRYALIQPFLIRGEISTLNIGTGGGVETLRLLRAGNRVTTIEISERTAAGTRRRVERAGFGGRHTGFVGHVLSVDLREQFHQVYMCEVLEHVMDDRATIKRLASWLLPGGRLIISTPTASYGQLSGDTLSTEEDGGHVRVGYDGPELDAMLQAEGLITIRRITHSHAPVSNLYVVERTLRRRRVTSPIGVAMGLAGRVVNPVLDRVAIRPSDQITVATKI